MSKKELPKTIMVYVCDEVDGETIYAVAHTVEDIPEEFDGEKVGTYTLSSKGIFRVMREMTNEK